MTNSKSHMGFRLAPRSMTLDDLELHKFDFFSEFLGISRISDATAAKRKKIGQYCHLSSADNVVGTSNWSNFDRLSCHAGLSAIAGLSCYVCVTGRYRFKPVNL